MYLTNSVYSALCSVAYILFRGRGENGRAERARLDVVVLQKYNTRYSRPSEARPLDVVPLHMVLVPRSKVLYTVASEASH